MPTTSPAPPRFHRRRDLLEAGWRDSALAAAVKDGRLIRPRGGIYLTPDVSDDVVLACRVGGRLACTSALRQAGVFVHERSTVHVHFAANASRSGSAARTVSRHWGLLRRQPHPRSTTVEVLDALIQAARCVPTRSWIASIDSALNQRLLAMDDLDEVFTALPARFGVARRLVEPRCQAGTETLVRLMLRTLGARVEVQVPIRGVGTVDFVVDGWLIVECDSFAHHSSWDAQRRDRRRDQAAAALGYATYRPIAEDILWNPDVVQEALSGLLRSRRSGRAPQRFR